MANSSQPQGRHGSSSFLLLTSLLAANCLSALGLSGEGSSAPAQDVYSWMPVPGPHVGSGSGLPPGAVLPDPHQTVGNGLIEIAINTVHPEIRGLTATHTPPARSGDSISLFVLDAAGVEYSLRWTDKTKHEVLFYSPTVVHTVISGVPRSYLGQPSNLYVSWHIVVNKGEAGVYTYCEVRYTPSLGIPRPIDISQIGIKLDFAGRPYTKAILSADESYSLEGHGALYARRTISRDKYVGLTDDRDERGLWAIVVDESRYDLEGQDLVELADRPDTKLVVSFLRRPPGRALNVLEPPKDNPQHLAKPWRATVGPLLLYTVKGQGSSASKAVRQRRDEELARLSQSSVEAAVGKKNGYDALTGSFLGELQEGIWEGRTRIRNAVVRLTLSNRYLRHGPVRVLEKGENGWSRSGFIIPSFEFSYPVEDYAFGYPEDYCFLFLPAEGSVRVEEAAKGVRLGHIINTAFLLEVENDETSHCWNFTQTSTSHGIEGLPETMAPRALRSRKHVMGLPYLLWWSGVVYQHGNPTTQVHLADLVSNGPERVQFKLKSWLDDRSFRYDTDVLIPYSTRYNRAQVSITATCEIGITAGTAPYTFRMPIGTEPSSRIYRKLTYLRSDGRVIERFIGNNDRSWTPWEELRVPGWYALSDSVTGRGNIGVLLRSASYTVHISCFDEEPEAFDEVFLCDLSVPGRKIQKGDQWRLQYEIMIYDDATDHSTVEGEFQRK